MIWSEGWVWIVAGLLVGIVEVLVPGWVFLGVAMGAVATGLILWIGGPVGAALAASLPVLLVVFGLLSLLAWVLLRRFAGVQRGQVKTFDHDINED